jgi:hypothetical protein
MKRILEAASSQHAALASVADALVGQGLRR